MVTTIFTWAVSALPLALYLIPVLAVALTVLMIAKWALPLLPVAEPSRNALVYAAGVVHSATLRILGLIFLFAFLAVNWMAVQGQQAFEAFQAEQRQH